MVPATDACLAEAPADVRKQFLLTLTLLLFFFLSAYYAYRASLRAEPDSCTRVDERSYNTNL